jgi:hypothetical protein
MLDFQLVVTAKFTPNAQSIHCDFTSDPIAWTGDREYIIYESELLKVCSAKRKRAIF